MGFIVNMLRYHFCNQFMTHLPDILLLCSLVVYWLPARYANYAHLLYISCLHMHTYFFFTVICISSRYIPMYMHIKYTTHLQLGGLSESMAT